MNRIRTTDRRATALLIALIMVILLAGMAYAMVLTSTAEYRGTENTVARTQALFAAQAGVARTRRHLRMITQSIMLMNPFGNLENMAGDTLFEDERVSANTSSNEAYTVRILGVDYVDNYIRDVHIESIGSVAHAGGRTQRRVEVRLRLELGRSEVFDYVYFINNWGWYYGDSIEANGNVRSNGQFDGGNYRARMRCHPRHEKLINGTELVGYVDQGGMYSGFNIVGQDRMRDDVNATWSQSDYQAGRCTQDQIGQIKYQHPFAPHIEMPNLTSLAPYEQIAKDFGSTIKVGGQVVVNAVVGDDPGEKSNLYLVGTNKNPIELNGPIVVRGNVVIRGVVTGQGSIYAEGNVYVPDDIVYKNGLTGAPTNPDKDKIETWLRQNKDRDALGLFARKHIVLGNYLDSNWQRYVRQWVQDPRNESGEDLGEDGIPNTRAGRDGILGTADDDVLEGDGIWTVDYYTQAHADMGVIPEGKSIGDVIPGSGEDTNGDGQYTGTTQMSEFDLPSRYITEDHYEGNVEGGSVDYNAIANSKMHFIDAVLYTNHTIGMYSGDHSNELRFTGALVSRNEAVVYRNKRLVLNYDFRLLDDGATYHLYLPRTWKSINVVMWKSD